MNRIKGVWCLLIALAVTAAGSALAAPIQLVKDVNRTIGPDTLGSINPPAYAEPAAMLSGGAVLALCGHRCGVWLTDGTSANTRELMALDNGQDAVRFTAAGPYVYFFVTGPSPALWRTDGTRAGTVRLTVPAPLDTSVRPVAMGSTLVFMAGQASVWRSDGTQAGTFKIKDSGIGPFDARFVHLIGGQAHFLAMDSAGLRLWRTDGTLAGTSLALDMDAGSAWRSAVLGAERLVYLASTIPLGGVVMVTDATIGGTHVIGSSANVVRLQFAGNFGGATQFLVEREDMTAELWTTDGTPGGSVRLKTWSGQLAPQATVLSGPYAYFVVDEFDSGRELWRTDGSAAGTVLVKDIRAGALSSSPTMLAAHGDKLYFRASPDSGIDLWATQGDDASTLLLEQDSLLFPWVSVGSRLLMYRSGGSQGPSLLSSDGSVAGTTLLEPAAGEPTRSSHCAEGQVKRAGFAYFFADDGLHGCELWKSDGTDAGTVLVKDIRPGSPSSIEIGKIVATSGFVFFVANDGVHGSELWKSDGTEAGTTLVGETFAGAPGISMTELVAVGEQVYFVTQGALWMTDDGAGFASVRPVPHNFDPDGEPRFPSRLTAANGLLFFTAQSTIDGEELWRTNGSAFGTFPLTLSLYVVSDIVAAGARVYVRGHEPETGIELWTSDGSFAGTRRVTDLRPGFDDGLATIVGPIGEKIVFTSPTARFDYELWISDGTEAGTRKLGDVAGGGPDRGVAVGGKLYYSNMGALFATDGQSLGTRVLDACCTQQGLLGGDGVAFFTHYDPATGKELWMSSGTPAGTALVEDFSPGAQGTTFHSTESPVFLAAGALLYLSGAIEGAEPFLVPIDAEPGALAFTPRTNVLTNSVVVSGPVAITGINAVVGASAVGGEFCVSSTATCSCDLAPFSTSGTVEFNDFICARHVSSPDALTMVSTTITVGSQVGTFTSTTGAASPATIGFAADAYAVTEDGTVTVTVTRAGSLADELSVQWSAAEGTALAGDDFNPSDGILTWAAGDGAPKTLIVGGIGAQVHLLDDAVVEGEEQFSLVLASPTGGAVLGALASTQIRLSDHADFIELEVAALTVSEAGPNAALRVIRHGARTKAATVTWRTANGTAFPGTDFGTLGSATPPSGVLTFAPGEAQKIIAIGPQASAGARIPLINDTLPEPSKTFQVSLDTPTGGALVGANAAATVTIGSEDSSIAMEVAFRQVLETDSFVELTVRRQGFGQPASVSYFTLDDTAFADAHYTEVSGTLNWSAFDNNPRTISIPIVQDSVATGAVSFLVRLAGVSGAQLLAPAATTVSIADVSNSVQLVGPPTVRESDGSVTLTVVRVGSAAAPASVGWATQAGTALAGLDFVAGSGTIEWAAGDGTSKAITIPLVADSVPEREESFSVVLSNPVGTSLGTTSASVTILDDDKGFVLANPAYEVSETAVNVILKVRRNGPASGSASVRWAASNGSATAGKDFGVANGATPPSGTLSWAIGDATEKSIVIPILKDVASEGPETFNVTLHTPSLGMIVGSPGSAVVTIVDDEIPAESRVTVAQAKILVLENAGPATIVLHREAIGGGFTAPLSVSFATVAGSALATSDFTTRTGTVTWSAADGGDKTISIPIVNNTVAEPHESFRVTLAVTTPGGQVATPEVIVTILDDDEPFPKFGAMPDGWEAPAGATAGWHVSNDPGAYDGVFSLRSDGIDDGETAQLEVTRTFAAGTIQFRVKVSSEAGFDKLRFFVDGVEKGTWSGTAIPGWQLFSTPISAGVHTIRWSYEKDESAAIGQDAAWLDSVVLP